MCCTFSLASLQRIVYFIANINEINIETKSNIQLFRWSNSICFGEVSGIKVLQNRFLFLIMFYFLFIYFYFFVVWSGILSKVWTLVITTGRRTVYCTMSCCIKKNIIKKHYVLSCAHWVFPHADFLFCFTDDLDKRLILLDSLFLLVHCKFTRGKNGHDT